MLITVAFLAGTITSGGFVYASFDNCEDPLPKGKPFLAIWEAICDLQYQINALGGSQVYETSETVLIEAGTSGGVAFEISCSEGDWMNVSEDNHNPFPDVKAISNQPVIIHSISYDLVKEPFSQITGATGLVEIRAMQLFDVEVTLTILCFSPAT